MDALHKAYVYIQLGHDIANNDTDLIVINIGYTSSDILQRMREHESTYKSFNQHLDKEGSRHYAHYLEVFSQDASYYVKIICNQLVAICHDLKILACNMYRDGGDVCGDDDGWFIGSDSMFEHYNSLYDHLVNMSVSIQSMNIPGVTATVHPLQQEHKQEHKQSDYRKPTAYKPPIVQPSIGTPRVQPNVGTPSIGTPRVQRFIVQSSPTVRKLFGRISGSK
jgi:hypothetical protein